MKIRYILMFVCFAFSKGIFAGTVSGAKISYYISTSGALFYFRPTIAITGTPVCNTQARFAVNTITQAGQDIMTAVINAKNANLSVNIAGTNVCTTSPTSENVSYITVTGTSAMIGLVGPAGPVGPRGPVGVATTSAVCVSASSSGAGICSCSGTTVSDTSALGSCSVTSTTGSCTATGYSPGVNGGISSTGSCCVCAP